MTRTIHQDRQSNLHPPNWTPAHTFFIIQITCQILLLFPGFNVIRIVMRTLSFGISLWFLWQVKGKSVDYLPQKPAIWIMLILALQFGIQFTHAGIIAALAQCAMYLAILGPVWWVSRCQITPKGFESLIFILWGFHTASCLFGVLQTYYPGQFQPEISTTILNSVYGGENLKVTLANGAVVYRPTGLTDEPGGAAISGFYSILFSAGIALTNTSIVFKLFCLGSSAVALFCIYTSHVRSILVMTTVCLMVFTLILVLTGRGGKGVSLGTIFVTILTTSFTWAVAIGGKETYERITSLFSDDARTVYYQNRGVFLEETFNSFIYQYPLGAGLGRWGMINAYFGEDNPLVPPIWVEIQWTGWIIDGGIPLMITYVLVLAASLYVAWQITQDKQLGNLGIWGCMMFAYNVGALALTFNYPLFISQGGMEFWALNTALFVAVTRQIDE